MDIELKKELKKLKVTQKDFAKILGVHLKTVNRWCMGKSEPSELRKRNIRIFLNVLKRVNRIEEKVEDLESRGVLPKGITPAGCPSYSGIWNLVQKLKE